MGPLENDHRFKKNAIRVLCWGNFCDPDLAIAKAKASQDHDLHRCIRWRRILILILAKASCMVMSHCLRVSPNVIDP